MVKRDFYYPSQDGVTRIHAIEWIPEGEVKKVLQISHGMVEYINRYDEFARFLVDKGYYVVGQDHLGHGDSVQKDEDHGFFHETQGNAYVIGDIHQLRKITMAKYPNLPYFMLGHSMGSFLTRQYIKGHGQGLAGVVLVGTGEQPAALLVAGKLLCKSIARFKGWRYRSRLVNQMAFGGFNKKFQPIRTSADWISKDTIIVDQYVADPWCSFVFTVNAYYQMFCGMQELKKKENFAKIPKDLPIFFVSGADDPVGNFGKSVQKVYQKYKKGKIKDVSIRLFKTDRHEVLNETDRQEVYKEIYQWLEKR